MKLNSLRDFFIFTQKERNGIIALSSIILVLLIVNITLPSFYTRKKPDFSAWEREIDRYLAKSESISSISSQSKSLQPPVPFDPNKVTAEKLKTFGIPPYVADNWMKYIKKGGKFKRREDIRKIYGLDSSIYRRITNFIVFVEEKPENNSTTLVSRTSAFSKDSMLKFQSRYADTEINSADSAAFEKLPGIGPVLSARIIKYRQLIGGYHSLLQLKEVYGLRDENYSAVIPYLLIDSTNLRKINLNFCNISELGKHPYVGFKTASRFLDYRSKKGKFTSFEELSDLMEEDSLKKLIPYLVF